MKLVVIVTYALNDFVLRIKVLEHTCLVENTWIE